MKRLTKYFLLFLMVLSLGALGTSAMAPKKKAATVLIGPSR